MQSVFEQIKDRLPITEVLATYITLIPSGSQYKAKCPFHSERSASFSVSPDRGLYYCFGCGAKGDIFTFVEQFEGVDRKGALKILADRAGVQLSREHNPRENTDPLYDMLETVTKRYQATLAVTPEALGYLRERGIDPATASLFRIGYVPDEWRYVANTLRTEAESVIGERAGLVKKTPKGYYDRFRKRIMFPLTDASGRVVGFSGRSFPDDSSTSTGQSSPKYLNSPETELFQKSRILFGFDKAKAAIRTHNFAILVEGQIDCVLSHQAGFKNTVATSGTAVSETAALDPTANLVVLARLTPNIFLAFDGDTAGQKALGRAAIVALRLGMNPKVVSLPPGTDPAAYIQEQGGESWKTLLKDSKHFILHQLHTINTRELSAHALVQTLKDRIFPFLAEVQSPVEQRSYIESIAKELSLTSADVARELSLFVATRERPTVVTVAPYTNTTVLEERFCALVERYPTTILTTLKDDLAKLAFEDHQFTFQEIVPERMQELLALVERDYGTLSSEDRDELGKELKKKLEDQFYGELRILYARLLADAEQAGDDAAIVMCMKKLQTLNLSRHESS